MKVKLESLPKNAEPIFITDEGTGYNNKPYKLNYLWIGTEDGHCIGTLSGDNLKILKNSFKRKRNDRSQVGSK